jgi:hypothetical protein
VRRDALSLAYVTIRIAAFVCITAAIISAIAGAHIAGWLLLSAFALFGIGGVLNVWLGVFQNRVLLGPRQIGKQSQPAIFWLWFVLNTGLVLIIAAAVVSIIIVRYS